jgi:nitrous-oxide reductase
MTSKKETKGLTRRDMLGQTSVIAAAGVSGSQAELALPNS